MGDVSRLITLGIGPGSTIDGLILLGLNPELVAMLTPAKRILTVGEEERVLGVAVEERLLAVEEDDRVLDVVVESRVLSVEAV